MFNKNITRSHNVTIFLKGKIKYAEKLNMRKNTAIFFPYTSISSDENGILNILIIEEIHSILD